MINLKRCSTLALCIVSLVGMDETTLANSAAWLHPGVLVTQANIDQIKTQLAANNPTYQTLFSQMASSKYAQKDYVIEGPPADGIIQCGSSSNPDIGCSSAYNDTTAAYTQALMWAITGDAVYAANAIKIMNTYAQKFKGYAGYSKGAPCSDMTKCSNGPLQAAWDTEKWPRAAELIRYAHNGLAGWSAADIAAFSKMLTTLIQPIIANGSNKNGNWELSMIEATMGIAVFTENASLFQQAQKMWQERVPAYFYDNAVDGSQPAPFPSGRGGVTDWNGQKIFNSNTDGVMQETCRDLQHAEMGFAAAVNAAETDYIQQGYTANLYTAQNVQARLVHAANLMAGLELAASTKAPKDFCTGASNQIILGGYPTYVMLYNHYHNRLNDPEMADMSGSSGLHGTANTYNWIHNGVMKMSGGTRGKMVVYETLTHYNTEGATPPPPPSRDLMITADDQKISYKQAIPKFTYKLNQQVTLATLPTCTSTASSNSLPGVYPITCQGAVLNGYTITYVNGKLTIIPLTATVTAKDQSMKQGDALPKFKYKLSSNLKLTKEPICTTTATSSSVKGTYPISCAAAELAGYTFNYVNGTLTVK